MRPIKFRAWHTKQGKMYPAEELGQDQMTLMPDGRGFANISGRSTSLSQIDYGRTMIPEQFTGLKDKNGKEIYEGDILLNVSPESITLTATVIYEAPCFKLVYHRPLQGTWGIGDTRNWQVIGNIHENPELVTDGTKQRERREA